MACLTKIDELINFIDGPNNSEITEEKKEIIEPIVSGNKVVVITGVTAGIGRSLALQFIKQGYIVAGCGRTQTKIDELNKQFDENKSFFTKVDVSDYNQVESWADQVCTALGSPRYGINF